LIGYHDLHRISRAYSADVPWPSWGRRRVA
jgi:hypothetical protein